MSVQQRRAIRAVSGTLLVVTKMAMELARIDTKQQNMTHSQVTKGALHVIPTLGSAFSRMLASQRGQSGNGAVSKLK